MKSVQVCLQSVIAFALAFAFAARLVGSEPSSATIRLRVRVEDRAGKPIPNAKGILFKMTPPRPQQQESARLDTEPPIVKAGSAATKDGYVETNELPAKSAYVLEIQADGFASELTRWSHPTQSGTIELPPVKLRRLGVIAGRVVDRKRQAVPNATVIQAGDGAKRLETVTDKDGKFRLADVPEGRTIVCFDAAGYRFDGAVLTSPTDGVEAALERPDEANSRGLKPVSLRHVSADQREALTKKLLELDLARVLGKSTVAEGDQAVVIMAARRDPKRILSRLDQLKFARPYMVYGVRYAIGSSFLAQGKPEAALAAIEKFKEPLAKVQAYLYWFEAEPAKSKYPDAHKTAIARARAILDAQKGAPQYTSQLCELGAQLWDVGDHDAARKVFQECQTLLDKIPAERNDKGWLRVQLAIAVSHDDLERARKLAADIEPDQAMRLAAAIARHQSKQVESFLNDVPGDLSLMQLRGVANHLPNVCLRVARQDPAAAERILLKYAQVPQPKTDVEKMFGLGGSFGLNLSKEFIEFQVTKLKAVCYGLIAEGAAANDPAAARRALEHAIELLKPLRDGFVYPMSNEYHGPAVLMAMLVPVAERIDPALAREVLWRALSLRIARSGESRDRERLDVDTCLLAGLVRLYDPSVSELLMQPVLDRARSRTFAGMGFHYWVIRWLALDSPDRALEWIDSLCDVPSADGSVPRDTAKRTLANVLNYEGYWQSDRAKQVESELFGIQSVYGIYVDRG